MKSTFYVNITTTGLLLAAMYCGCNETKPNDDAPWMDTSTGESEICDGLDNDLDALVDEDFKDTGGAYVHDLHCGACGSKCANNDITLSSECVNSQYGPECRATACVEDYAISRSHNCVRRDGWICAKCLDDGDCGNFDGAGCEMVAGEQRCTIACSIISDCPTGYGCESSICTPNSGSCDCGPEDDFMLSCTIEIQSDDTETETDEASECFGTAVCADGILSECTGSDELCDGIDNDCNGIIDDPFVNDGGFYNDLYNCGACGVDCTLTPLPNNEVTCGGPATSPLCSMLCEDTVNGLEVGDWVDADLLVENGCECRIASLSDNAGPMQTSGSDLDINCDGADGVVANSFYVSLDGNDSSPGSPILPLGSIETAITKAYESLSTSNPRPHVFISAGSYPEVLTLKQGVRIHGGYSPDFLTRNQASYTTEIRATNWNSDTGGAALIAVNVGISDITSVDGITFKGAFAPSGGQHAYGAFLLNSGSNLFLSDLIVHAGDGTDGANGINGEAGTTADNSGSAGVPPRAAEENSSHTCINSTINVVQGGNGAEQTCNGNNQSGGKGGDSTCATSTESRQAGGTDGNGIGGGNGGLGGYNTTGPIYGGNGTGCTGGVCCGLADFSVSSEYEIASDGTTGRAGQDGEFGAGCFNPNGLLDENGWVAALASEGTSGGPGAGGGGGGAGGGADIDWVPPSCTYEDALGGGGGGGGAGGCGGNGGKRAFSGGPSVGMVVITNTKNAPVIENVLIQTGKGGDGGQGGHGGDGGQGSLGGKGGSLEPNERTTPSLAGSSSGGNGGSGGPGGAGGAGGGGCGGSTVGIWFHPTGQYLPGAVSIYRDNNTFQGGSPGQGGAGGSGNTDGKGTDGEVINVYQK